MRKSSMDSRTISAGSTAPTNEPDPALGVVVVDHGSRRASSNQMLETFVEHFALATKYPIVEPAHMELAEPSIATAFGRCVERGARRVVVMPYFLLPGRHWHQDIPDLTRRAAESHPGVEYLVGSPIGLHPLMTGVIQARLEHCLAHSRGEAESCESCAGSERCRFETF